MSCNLEWINLQEKLPKDVFAFTAGRRTELLLVRIYKSRDPWKWSQHGWGECEDTATCSASTMHSCWMVEAGRGQQDVKPSTRQSGVKICREGIKWDAHRGFTKAISYFSSPHGSSNTPVVTLVTQLIGFAQQYEVGFKFPIKETEKPC